MLEASHQVQIDPKHLESLRNLVTDGFCGLSLCENYRRYRLVNLKMQRILQILLDSKALLSPQFLVDLFHQFNVKLQENFFHSATVSLRQEIVILHLV